MMLKHFLIHIICRCVLIIDKLFQSFQEHSIII
ncbi:hypothetical protein ACFW04_001084 [Cataglyphis niger]